jgi:hypothetical protein
MLYLGPPRGLTNKKSTARLRLLSLPVQEFHAPYSGFQKRAGLLLKKRRR